MLPTLPVRRLRPLLLPRTMAFLFFAVLLGLLVHSASAGATATLVINEFVFNHVGTDTNEYVEIFGRPNTSYSSYSLIVIEGDAGGTAQGTVDRVEAVGSTDANGYWWTGFLATNA